MEKSYSKDKDRVTTEESRALIEIGNGDERGNDIDSTTVWHSVSKGWYHGRTIIAWVYFLTRYRDMY